MIETTGPKISSCAMRILGSTSLNTVGSMKPAMLVFALVEAIAAVTSFAPSFFADVDVFQIGLQLILVDCRTHVDGFVQAVADLDLLRPATK